MVYILDLPNMLSLYRTNMFVKSKIYDIYFNYLFFFRQTCFDRKYRKKLKPELAKCLCHQLDDSYTVCFNSWVHRWLLRYCRSPSDRHYPYVPSPTKYASIGNHRGSVYFNFSRVFYGNEGYL